MHSLIINKCIPHLATFSNTSQLNSVSAKTRLVSMMRMAVMRRSLSGSRMSLANHSLPLRRGFAERKSTSGEGPFRGVSRHDTMNYTQAP